MKILHIHTTMRSGGIEAVICGLSNEMSKTNDVTCCTIFEPSSNDVFYNKLNPSVRKMSLGKKDSGFSVKEILKICRLIDEGRYDAVNIHGCFQYYWLSVLLFHRRTKFFYTIHTDASRENFSWDRYLVWMKRLFFKKRFMRAVTISPSSQRSFKELYGCESHLIYNGTEYPCIDDSDKLSSFRLSDRTKIFIHPGRITEAKNQLVLCKVFKRLIDEGHDLVLLIYGAPEDQAIYDRISPYFSDRIRYMGEYHDIPSLMAQSDAFVLPSIWEGLPVTLLEALAVGSVPICSPVGGINDVVQDGVNGILSLSAEEDDFYGALKRYLNMNEAELQSIQLRARVSFEKFSILKSVEEYLKAYSE